MRRRVLFLSQCLPFPPDSGVTNRTYHILQELQRSFDVTLVAFSRRNHQRDAAARANATQALSRELSAVEEPVAIEAEWSLGKKLRIHLASLLSGKAYTFFEYGNPAFGSELKRALEREPPDIVHVDSMDLFRWLPLLPDVPIACTHHNVESDLLRLRAEHITNPALGAYVALQARRVERVERELCPRVAMNVMTSDVDASRIRALAPGSRTAVVPNGVDTNFFCPTPEDAVVPGRITFLGPTYMFPNRDGIEFFLASIWPMVRNECPEATLHLIGKTPLRDKEEFESTAGVTSQGYVPDIRPHFSAAACSVVPLRVGGGTRLKILDAWAMGKAVVSTSVGCEGLNAVDGDNILIRDRPADFATAVAQVLRDSELRQRLSRGGRETSERVYAWPVIGRKLTSLYNEMLA